MTWMTHTATHLVAQVWAVLSEVLADALRYACMVIYKCKQVLRSDAVGKLVILVCIQILWKLMLHEL